jgi:hypothetical protein
MIDTTTLQTWLKQKGLYAGTIDGKVGPLTRAAVVRVLSEKQIGRSTWAAPRIWFAAEQLFLEEQGHDVGDIDGLYGPKTQVAHEVWITKQRDTDPADDDPIVAPAPTIKNVWPRQKDVPAYYGERGANQVSVPMPYKIYYGKELVKRISLHTKVANSASRVFDAVLKEYGPERIRALALDQYSGSLNVRKMRGGSAWSMHSWGIAIDWDAGNNALHMDHTRARFAKPEYATWWAIWEAEGWLSLGRARDFDWMHVQAARL